MKFIIKKFWEHVDKSDRKRIASQKAPEGVVCVSDIPYSSDGNKMHTLDIYYAEGTDKLQPVIFDIHGGGWVYGTKEINKYFCMNLVKYGFTVVNINYRLTTEAVFPACLQDVFAALNWLAENGKNYYADISKLAVAGDSAGGHLALITAIVSKNAELMEKLEIKTVPEIKALGLISGAFDMEKYMSMRIFNSYKRLVFGDEFVTNSALDIGKPFKYLANTLPPTYLVSSKWDFARADTLSISPRLQKLGINYKCRYITEKAKNKPIHVFNVIRPEWAESVSVNAEMCEFFKENI